MDIAAGSSQTQRVFVCPGLTRGLLSLTFHFIWLTLLSKAAKIKYNVFKKAKQTTLNIVIVKLYF